MKISSRIPSVALCAVIGLAASCGSVNAKLPADSATRRVASAPDDRPPQAGSAPGLASFCDTAATVICYQDTARVPAAGPSEYPLANWIWFAAAGDSIEISANPPATIVTSIGEERDSLNNTARYFRRRFSGDGVVEVFLALEQGYGDTVPYTLSILRSGASSSASLRPSGQAATLTVVTGHRGESFSLVPLSISPSVRDRSHWRIYGKSYRVALVSDSLYELCRLPCSASDTVKLTPYANVVRKF